MEQEDFSTLSLSYLGTILDQLIDYIPYENKITDTFDFVEDIGKFGELDEKVAKFNDYFKIVPNEEVP